MDYEDFLRQRSLPQWPASDPLRASLVARRCQTADEVADWVREVREEALRRGRCDCVGQAAGASLLSGNRRQCGPDPHRGGMLPAAPPTGRPGPAFTQDGGFTERLHRVRTALRKKGNFAKMD